jgi:hypothetical protein
MTTVRGSINKANFSRNNFYFISPNRKKVAEIKVWATPSVYTATTMTTRSHARAKAVLEEVLDNVTCHHPV